jgi:hypothetical protein
MLIFCWISQSSQISSVLSVPLKKRENHDDIDFLQMNGYVPCGIISIWVYFFYQKQVPVLKS